MKLFNYLIFLPFYINPETLSIVSVSHGVSGVPIGWVIILFYFLSSIGAKNISKVLNGVVKEHSIESLIFLVLMVLVSAISIISSSYKIFQLTAFIGLTMVILFNINIRYLCLDKAMSGLILFVILHFFSLLLNTNSPPNFIFNDTLIHGARSSYIVIISFLLVYLFSKLADGGVIFFKTIIISCTLYVGYRLGVDALLVFILIFIPWLVIFTIIKSPHNKAVYVYLTSIIFIVIPAVSVLFFYAISEFINLYDAINIRIRVWIEHIVKIEFLY